MSRIGAAFARLLPAAAVIAAMLGSVSPANAQPYPPPPPGWRGPHYYWHGQYYHHHAWAYDRHHHRYVRYW
jgi:hypothetical protein